jgi:hypothetical protein
MAQWKLGRQEEARHSLAEAEKNLDTYGTDRTPGMFGTLPPNFKAEIDLIRQEADALIK